jgi:NAD(P)-dependent dehydrogenase (short-subunit alcohol dehydrogenase family)
LSTIPEKVIAETESRLALRRLGKAKEIANVDAFLANGEASDIHGAGIEVSGGMSV